MLTDNDRPQTTALVQTYLLDLQAGDLDKDGDVDMADLMQLMDGYRKGTLGLADLLALADNYGHQSKPLLLDGMDHVPADQRPADLGLSRIRTTGSGWGNYSHGGTWQERWPTLDEVRLYSKRAAAQGCCVYMFDIEEGYSQFDEAGWREYLERTAELYQVAAEAGIGVGQFGQFPWPPRYKSWRLDNETANGMAMEIVMPHCQFISRGYYFGRDPLEQMDRLEADVEFVRGWIDRPFLPYINPTFWYRATPGSKHLWHGNVPMQTWMDMVELSKACADATVLWGDVPQFAWEAAGPAYLSGTWMFVLMAMYAWGLRVKPPWFNPQTLAEQGEG